MFQIRLTEKNNFVSFIFLVRDQAWVPQQLVKRQLVERPVVQQRHEKTSRPKMTQRLFRELIAYCACYSITSQDAMSQKVVGSNPAADKGFFITNYPFKCTCTII